MKEGKVKSFGKYFLAYQRAKARAGEIMRHVNKQRGDYVIPPEIDPFKGKFEEEVTKVLLESELMSDQYRTKEPDQ